jgi:hypothetical protein
MSEVQKQRWTDFKNRLGGSLLERALYAGLANR